MSFKKPSEIEDNFNVKTQNTNTPTFLSLTALWALVESGLGGIMHALHLPFTGVFIGGFAILIIALLGAISENPFQSILKATFLVLLIKAGASPYTSPTAYVAVGFQGLLGALLFYKKSWYNFTAIPFAVISMVESALQKLLMLYLIFGNTIVEAIQIFIESIVKSFGLENGEVHYVSVLIILYGSIYLLWGFVLGIWMIKLPRQLEHRADWYYNLKPNDSPLKQKGNKSDRWWKLALIVFSIILIFSYFYTPAKGLQTGIYLVLRTSILITMWFIIIIPLSQKLMQNLRNKKQKENNSLQEITLAVSSIKSFVKPLYKILKTKYKGVRLLKELVLGLMVISLYNLEK